MLILKRYAQNAKIPAQKSAKVSPMPDLASAIHYPRRRIRRTLARGLGRALLTLGARVHIKGRENFPRRGPLIVVGNHVAVMEAVLMVVLPPWPVELIGSVDVPHERSSDLIMRFYGFIPVRRGSYDRAALTAGLNVLRQGGILGIFPEGGHWEAGAMRGQTGVAWLSQKSGAPVLPIGFSGMYGALAAMLHGQRPRMGMTVGRPLPAARVDAPGGKAYLEGYAAEVVAAVRALLPPEELSHGPAITDERLSLETSASDGAGAPAAIPEALAIRHGPALAKFLHRPVLLKIFRQNLHLDAVAPLQRLHVERDPQAIARAVEPILAYLKDDNPYLLAYRFGPEEGEAMRLGLAELHALASWAADAGLRLEVRPVRRYMLEGQEVVQVEQEGFERWR